MGRDGAMREAYDVMATRLKNRMADKSTQKNRLSNPLAATLSTTGGGKSFFLDELGALRHGDLQNLCAHEGMREILKNSVSYK